MGDKEFLQTKGFYLVALMLVVLILHPLNLFGKEENPEKTFKVEVTDNLVTVNVQDADLSEVLKEIGNKTGIKIAIVKELMKEKVTVSFENLDMESALKDILRDRNYILTISHDPEKKDKRVLREVEVKNEILGSKSSKGEMTTIEIPYGSGKGEVGSNAEPPIGPKSFAVDANGDIYICDTLNNRIQVFSSHGVYLSTIPLQKAILPEDIVMDAKGFIYIYDNFDNLYQYDKKGNIISTIHVADMTGARGPIQIIDNVMYAHVYSGISSDVIIGRILFNDVLVGPSVEDQKGIREKGKGAPSGKKYMTGVTSYGSRSIEIAGKDRTTSKFISFPSYESGSWIAFMGEDGQGHSYFSANGRDENGEAVPEVHKLDARGNYISTVRMPPVRVSFWAIKDYEIGRDGTLYGFRAEEDKLRLYIYRFSPAGN